MKLVVGLGNPGKTYEKTRHNAGFMALDLLRKTLDFEDFREESRFKGNVSIGRYQKPDKLFEKVILFKPLTFMNLSGEAVANISQFYKIKPEDCLVIYDDLDLALGSLRIRKKGSAGTHNGMKSILPVLGENFLRLRLGIESRGISAPKLQDTSSFVLEKFNSEEFGLFDDVLEKAVAAVQLIISGKTEEAMNLYNNLA